MDFFFLNIEFTNNNIDTEKVSIKTVKNSEKENDLFKKKNRRHIKVLDTPDDDIRVSRFRMDLRDSGPAQRKRRQPNPGHLVRRAQLRRQARRIAGNAHGRPVLRRTIGRRRMYLRAGVSDGNRADAVSRRSRHHASAGADDRHSDGASPFAAGDLGQRETLADISRLRHDSGSHLARLVAVLRRES